MSLISVRIVFIFVENVRLCYGFEKVLDKPSGTKKAECTKVGTDYMARIKKKMLRNC